MPPAGYSGTPLPRKLGIKDGASLALFMAPEGFLPLLEPLPAGISLDCEPAAGTFDVIVAFFSVAAEYYERLAHLKLLLATAGGLWIAWPKKASGVTTDLDFNVVQQAGLAIGLVDNKVCAIDETWSGLRFVYRRTDRPGGKR